MLLISNMSQRQDILFKALADPTRRSMLDLLKKRQRTTGELVEHFPGLSRCGVMKHLEILVDATLVVVRREGRYRWNYLNPAPLQHVLERWLTPLVRQRGGMLGSLKNVSEKLSK